MQQRSLWKYFILFFHFKTRDCWSVLLFFITMAALRIMFSLRTWSISKQAACGSHFQFLSNTTGTAVNKARCRFATNTFNASKIVHLLFSLNQSSRPLIPAKQFLATLKGQREPEQRLLRLPAAGRAFGSPAAALGKNIAQLWNILNPTHIQRSKCSTFLSFVDHNFCLILLRNLCHLLGSFFAAHPA